MIPNERYISNGHGGSLLFDGQLGAIWVREKYDEDSLGNYSESLVSIVPEHAYYLAAQLTKWADSRE